LVRSLVLEALVHSSARVVSSMAAAVSVHGGSLTCWSARQCALSLLGGSTRGRRLAVVVLASGST
jgi:hypothetical protein